MVRTPAPEAEERLLTNSDVSVLEVGDLEAGFPRSVLAVAAYFVAVLSVLIVKENITAVVPVSATSPALLLVGLVVFCYSRYHSGMTKKPVLDGETAETFLVESRLGHQLCSFLAGTSLLFDPTEKLCNPSCAGEKATGETWAAFVSMCARVIINFSALSYSCVRLGKSVHTSDWSSASLSLFLDSLILAHLLGSLFAEYRRSAVGQIVVLLRRLSSESGLTCLRNVTLKQAKTSYDHYSHLSCWLKALAFPTYVVIGLLGVVVFFEKVSEIPVRELKLAIQLGTLSGEGWDMLRVLMLGNQLLSVTPTEEFEYQRLLQLIFARDDGILDQTEKTFMVAYSEAVYETLWAMPEKSRLERAAIVCSFGSQGLQRFMYRQAKELP